MATTHTSRTGTYPEEGIKAPCVVAALTNITLSGEQTINSVACVAGDRVLTTAQTDTTENGIWICAVGSWERSSDWSDARDVTSGVIVPEPHSKITYMATFTGDFVAGTTAVTFTLLATAADFEPTIEYTIGTLTSPGGVVTIPLENNVKIYQLQLTVDVTSWVFTGLPSAGKCKDIEVEITQHASSAKTVISPASTGCTAGGAWIMSSTASDKENLGMRVFSDGTVHLYPSGVFE